MWTMARFREVALRRCMNDLVMLLKFHDDFMMILNHIIWIIYLPCTLLPLEVPPIECGAGDMHLETNIGPVSE